MKPKLCMVGYGPVIAIGKEIAAEYKSAADFIFVNSLLECAGEAATEVSNRGVGRSAK